MAFQRPFLISLKRSDSSYRWGFGIQGGKDQGEPIRIQSILDDSLAERSGLREGDEIIQVGKVNVQDLSLGQVYELLARCGNRIEMFVVREDLLSPRKGKEPPVVKAVVHNPYNSPLSLYSTENIAETLAKQTEVLTEGQISAEEDEGPENLTFKEKSAVFKLLEEQNKEEGGYSRQSSQVRKPKSAPPPPPKPKPPSGEQYYNGFDSHPQVYQDQQRSNRVEYQNTQKVVNQYQYQQEQPVQYQKTTVYQTSSQQRSPGYQSPLRENYQEPSYQTTVSSYQTYQNQQPPATNYQQTYQQNTYQYQTQGYQSPVATTKQQHPGYQSPSTTNYQQLNQINYQQNQNYQSRAPVQQSQQNTYQQTNYQTQPSTQQQQNQQQTNYLKSQQQTNYQQSQQQVNYQKQKSPQQTNYHQPTSNQQVLQTSQQQQQQKPAQSPTAVSKAEFKIGPPPPPRNTTNKQDTSNMTAIYRQQYEQHLQKQYEQQMLMNNNIDDESAPKAHIIEGEIFEHNSTSGTPITYKAPPSAPPKPNWPPPPSSDQFRSPVSDCPGGSHNVASVWPPKKSSAVELPRTGFNPAAVREQGTGRRCVWPPPSDEYRSGRNTPQSPITGRRIQWNPSPSPPNSRRTTFSPSHSPARRKDIAWPPPAPNAFNNKENVPRPSPKCTRKARFDDYIHEHASINVPQTYRPPPGTQHIEFY